MVHRNSAAVEKYHLPCLEGQIHEFIKEDNFSFDFRACQIIEQTMKRVDILSHTNMYFPVLRIRIRIHLDPDPWE